MTGHTNYINAKLKSTWNHTPPRIVIAMGLIVVARMVAQTGDELGRRLESQFTLTKVSADRNDIITAGTVVGLGKSGLLMYSTSAPVPALNSYRNGKFSLSFTQDLIGSVFTPGKGTIKDYPQRRFRAVDRLWVTGIAVHKDGVVFTLYSDLFDNIRYYGQLKFGVEKNAPPTPDEALARIAEVIQPIDAAQMERVAGPYAMGGTPGNQLQLNADGTLSLVQSGRDYVGRFLVQGNTMLLQIANAISSGTLQGDTLVDGHGSKWVKQATTEAPVQAASGNSPAPIQPPPPPPDEAPAPPKTISIGQSRDEVIAILGQPQKIARIGTKEILFYVDLNVTLISGKVADAQPSAKEEL